jgi:GalNAc-alpha-(1->4)-GalNAc-alpha-(1->3)-diNAcBac-PP-undecaprenol alpha-1,4-N-acetyl-D-galactosaminyltransferase
MSRAERIAVIVSALAGGGTERVVIDLCRHLCGAGRTVTLVTLSGDDPDAYSVPEGVRRLSLEIRRPAASIFETIRFSWAQIVAMRRMIIAEAPDVVVSFIDQTNVRAVACLLGTGIPVIVSERVHPGYHLLPVAWRIARRLTYPWACLVVVQTFDIAEWFRNETRIRRLVLIPNAVRYRDNLQISPINDQEIAAPKLISAMGRLTRQKGFDLLLEAFSRSGLIQDGWRLEILGDGAERDALLKQAEGLGISQALSLPGRVDEIARHLHATEIFALSSRYEGTPNALLEAMQMGKACVSFDCPSGPRDLIAHNINGLLVPTEDVAGLSEALRRLAQDADLRGRLGAEAARIVEKFSPSTVYGRWLNCIDEAAVGNRYATERDAAGLEKSIGRASD